MEAAPQYVSCVEAMTELVVSGWIVDPGRPTRAIHVELVIDGQVADTQRADAPRDALLAQYPSSEHGFDFHLPAPLAASQTIAVRVAAGAHVVPWHVPPVFRAEPTGEPVQCPAMTEAELTVALNPEMIAAALASPPYRGLGTTFGQDPLATILYHAATMR